MLIILRSTVVVNVFLVSIEI